jgi:SAM-dependent methyltransferase
VTHGQQATEWLGEILGVALPGEGASVVINGHGFIRREGILRHKGLVSSAQAQTAAAFGYKWQRRSSYEEGTLLSVVNSWLRERYGDPAAVLARGGARPVFLDAGCGSGVSALELFGDDLRQARYIGVDISEAIDVARARFAERNIPGSFLQCDLMQIPLPPASVDLVFSEGVMHHTDSTEAALGSLARLIKPCGYFLFYVYRRKGPIREFTDDYIREKLAEMTPQAAWQALLPLTKFGHMLDKLNIEIELSEPIELLQIPAGKINLQRFFYWHVFKAYSRPEMALDEMNHVNFDWYAPRNAHRQSPEEVREWCAAAGLDVERERVEEAGITVVARKRGGK